MTNQVVGVLAFAAGVVVGGAAVYIFTRKKNEERINQDLQATRDELAKYMTESEKKAQEEKTEKRPVEVSELVKHVELNNYISEEEKQAKGPYVIEQGGEDFGGYMAVSLEYYTDGVLLDGEEIIDDKQKDDLVGIENLARLSMLDPVIWVRNDKLKVDYEIAYIDEDFYDTDE